MTRSEWVENYPVADKILPTLPLDRLERVDRILLRAPLLRANSYAAAPGGDRFLARVI